MKSFFIFFIIVGLGSCNSTGDKTNADKDHPNKIPIDEKKLTEQAALLDGYWMTDDLLQKVENSKSIYSNREPITKLFGFTLNRKNLLTDSAYLNGFTVHEGGYGTPLMFDPKVNIFVNDVKKVSKFGAFQDPFELKIKNENLLEMYFPKSNHSDVYRKVIDDQIELRKVLFEGIYEDTLENKIEFFRNGDVAGFKSFKYFEIIYDFGEGIEFDAIVLFNNKKGGNWSDGEIYKFQFLAETLMLNHVETDWDEMNHKISSDTVSIMKK